MTSELIQAIAFAEEIIVSSLHRDVLHGVRRHSLVGSQLYNVRHEYNM